MADVSVQQNENGDYALGAVLEGVFVPFAVVPAARVRSYQERVEVLKLRSGQGDVEADAALAADYQGDVEADEPADEPASKSGGKAKG